MVDTGNTSPGTISHDEPVRPNRTGRQPALVVAFPKAAALKLPPSLAPAGRQWLAEQGLEDHEVSSSHLRFSRSGGALRVADAGSHNGTWIDGLRLAAHEPVQLEDGAILRLGRSILIYREAFGEAHEPSPPLIDGLVAPYGLRNLEQAITKWRASSPSNILIEGETGTGKELASKAIATALGRNHPYSAINVAGVPAGVFESQLFGHVAGAFSGAGQPAEGVFAAHQGGTVLLDEIGELPPNLQPKLLRVVENREVFPVGAKRPIKVDVLLIAATNRSLAQMVRDNQFRRDLLARLLRARVELPPLRERAEDIWAIAQELPTSVGAQFDSDQVEVEAVERLLLEPWPDNVRGLTAALADVVAADPSPGLRAWSVERTLGPVANTRTMVLTTERVQGALAACGGSERAAAKQLGISRGKLRRFLNRT